MARKSTMSGKALLAAVIESPDSDEHRQAYAAWLDDHGRPEFAEFIRVQLELARMPDDHPQRPALEQRQRHLECRHEEAWHRFLGLTAGRWRRLDSILRRGFPESVWGYSHVFVRLAPRLMRRAPVLHVRLWATPSDPPRLYTRRDAEELAASPYLARVESLDLSGNDWGDEEVEQLAASPHPVALSRLSLAGNRIGARGIRALARWPALRRVSYLDLSGNNIDDESAAALAASPNMVGVISLRLDASPSAAGRMTDAGVAALAASPHLGGVRDLGLANHPIGTRGVVHLGRSPFLRPESLGLAGCGLGPEEAAALGNSDCLGSVRVLEQGDNRLGDGGAAALAAGRNLTSLQVLGLSGNRLGARGVIALLRSERLGGVVSLDLRNNGLAGTLAEVFAEPGLARFTRLEIVEEGLTADDVAAVAACPYLSNLAYLGLGRIPREEGHDRFGPSPPRGSGLTWEGVTRRLLGADGLTAADSFLRNGRWMRPWNTGHRLALGGANLNRLKELYLDEGPLLHEYIAAAVSVRKQSGDSRDRPNRLEFFSTPGGWQVLVQRYDPAEVGCPDRFRKVWLWLEERGREVM
jgi:uncharacterized protein (TIGR02996 family)